MRLWPPSISGQFSYANIKLGQVVTGIKRLGFHNVVEAALGADMVAYDEAKELAEKGFLTSSCCPAFVEFVEKNFPMLKENISHNPVAYGGYSQVYQKRTTLTARLYLLAHALQKKAEIRKDGIKRVC